MPHPGCVTTVGHSLVTSKVLPGGTTWRSELPPGLQSSEDHTRWPPLVTVNVTALEPTSQEQAVLDSLVKRMVILMTPPTAPAFGSGTATSDRSDVAHLPPLPEADGDAEPDADAESELEGEADSDAPEADEDGEALPLGVAEAEAEPEGRADDALGEALAGAEVGDDPPEGQSRMIAMITRITPPITRARRRQ